MSPTGDEVVGRPDGLVALAKYGDLFGRAGEGELS